MVAALQALQRLSASRFASAEALVAAPAAGRLFAALACGDDAVAAEAARLLTRLWAPAVRLPAHTVSVGWLRTMHHAVWSNHAWLQGRPPAAAPQSPCGATNDLKL